MRIISGIYKNRRINFNHLNARPTTDFAKESLFNLLKNSYQLNEITVLDLFGGSGNISYEFVSRGAKEITCVDNNIKCVRFMKKIKLELNMKELNIIYSKAISYLKKTKSNYDVIFADPPYNYRQEKYDKILIEIFQKNILNSNGTVVIEHSKFIKFNDHKYFFIEKKYGSVHFSFFKK